MPSHEVGNKASCFAIPHLDSKVIAATDCKISTQGDIANEVAVCTLLAGLLRPLGRCCSVRCRINDAYVDSTIVTDCERGIFFARILVQKWCQGQRYCRLGIEFGRRGPAKRGLKVEEPDMFIRGARKYDGEIQIDGCNTTKKSTSEASQIGRCYIGHRGEGTYPLLW